MRLSLPLIFLALAGPVQAIPPRVMTDMAVTQSLVATVMGDLGTADTLIPAGTDAHHFQMRPSQAGALAAADLVVWIGPELTPWLARALRDGDEAETLALLHTSGTLIRSYDDDAHAEGDHSEGEHAEGDHARQPDPHAWLDTDNAALWLSHIADRLAALDPENAMTYRANASLGQERIAALAKRVQERLGPVGDTGLIVAHDAFGYFADEFGLTGVLSLADGGAGMPGAAHLSDLGAALEKGSIACVFPEFGEDPKQPAQLAKAGKTRLGQALDPEGRSLPPGAALYENMMDGLGTTIRACVNGD